VQVKLLAQEGELYVLAQSRDRVAKERAMRRRQLKRLWARLKQLSNDAADSCVPTDRTEPNGRCSIPEGRPRRGADTRAGLGRSRRSG
jgi:hypothetical protein